MLDVSGTEPDSADRQPLFKPRGDTLLFVSLVLATVTLGRSSGGAITALCCTALACAVISMLLAVPLGRTAVRRGLTAIALSVAIAAAVGLTLSLSRGPRLFRSIFDSDPTAAVKLTHGRVTTETREAAGYVRVANVSREDLDALILHSPLVRSANLEKSVRERPEALQFRAVGTEFLKDVEPTTTLEIYTLPGEASDRRHREAIYDPATKTIHAFWFDF